MTKFPNNQNNKKREYNLEERLALFAEKIIELMKKIPKDAINSRMISQIVASAGSTGANYAEANESESKKDFIHKTSIVKKELRETKHWLRLLAKANPNYQEEFREIWKENQELLLIFAQIIRTCKGNKS
ncbi:MAG: four helix bundle protein [Patescibacteria group bacterium]|nr:four helix bundle protein [Patescibacteria group bacterium]